MVKVGETTHGEFRYGAGNQKRYSKEYLKEQGFEYEPIDTGTKKEMYHKQNELIKRFEGIYGKKPKLNKNGR